MNWTVWMLKHHGLLRAHAMLPLQWYLPWPNVELSIPNYGWKNLACLATKWLIFVTLRGKAYKDMESFTLHYEAPIDICIFYVLENIWHKSSTLPEECYKHYVGTWDGCISPPLVSPFHARFGSDMLDGAKVDWILWKTFSLSTIYGSSKSKETWECCGLICLKISLELVDNKRFRYN
jgi:hypothetical protein